MMRKAMKMMGIILICVMLINLYQICSTNSCAVAMSDVSSAANWWRPSTTTVEDDLDKKVEVIATVVRHVGVLISVITLVVIGIKFMLGSVEEKAQYKQTLMPWFIGAILLFGMSNITMLIYNASKSMFN